MPTVKSEIERKLTAAFSPNLLNVMDDSEQHRGHGGWREGGETHFNVEMVSASFKGMSRVAMQRAVFGVLSEEMNGPVHAMSLNLKAS